MLRRPPRSGAVLNQPRVGLNTLSWPVERNDWEARLLLSLQVYVAAIGGDEQQSVDLALHKQSDVGTLYLEVRVRVAEDKGIAVFPGHPLDRLGASGHEGIGDIVDHQPYRARAISLKSAGHFVRSVIQPFHDLRHPRRRRRIYVRLFVDHP